MAGPKIPARYRKLNLDVGTHFMRDAVVVDAGTSTGPIRVKLSDESVDRYGTILRQTGWQLDAYRRNPIVLWGHDDSIPAIGRSEKIEVVDSVLYGEPVFARDTNPLARMVEDLIRGKFLNAFSIGWRTLKWSYDEEKDQLYFDEMELCEYSVVNVPGNANALVEGRAAGIDIDPAIEHAERLLRQIKSDSHSRLVADLERIVSECRVRRIDNRRTAGIIIEVSAPTDVALASACRAIGIEPEPKITRREEEENMKCDSCGTACARCCACGAALDEAHKCTSCGVECSCCAHCGTQLVIEEQKSINVDAVRAAVREALAK